MKHTLEISDTIAFLFLEGDLIGEQSGIALLDVVNNFINDGILFSAVDLSGVRYMNSAGIGVMITMLTKLRNAGGDMLLINPSDQIKKLLVITKLNSIFRIASDREHAVSLINPAA